MHNSDVVHSTSEVLTRGGQMQPDQRLTPRLHVYRPVRLHTPGRLQIIETLTKDLSLGGLRCLSPSVVPVSTSVDVELTLSTGGEPVKLRGKTVWFRTIPESEQFDLGIAFFDLSAISKRRLSVYLETLSRQLAISSP